MTVRGSSVLAIHWVDEHSKVQLKQLLVGAVCNVGFGVLREEADVPVVRAFALNLTVHTIQLSAVQLQSGVGVRRQHFKAQHFLAVPPY